MGKLLPKPVQDKRFVRVNGEKIVALRTSRGWNQEKLADEARLSKRTVEEMEKGGQHRPDSVGLVAKAFGIEVAELIVSEEVVSQEKEERRSRIPFLAVTGLLASVVLAGVVWQLLRQKPALPRQPPISSAQIPSGGGKPAPPGPLSVEKYYTASGKMGDTGDIVHIGPGEEGGHRFVYEARGRGPHEWEWKYVDGRENPAPAQFAGVMYQDGWGILPDDGYDLRGMRRVCWEARSLAGPANVEFVIGGINWRWESGDQGRWDRVKLPYADSMPGVRLGTRKVTERWQAYQESLAAQPEEAFRRVIGAFGWIISWNANGLEPRETEPTSQIRRFVIEIRRIRYER